MQKSASFPAAISSRVANLLRGSQSDTRNSESSDNVNMLSSTFKAAKADLRKRLNLSKDKSSTRLNELQPLASSEESISRKPTKRSLLKVLFDTKSGRKLHKRTRSDPTAQSGATSEVPELQLTLQPSTDARVFSVGTNRALDAVFDATTSSDEYYTCPSDSYDSLYNIDEWSISDHGTVLIRRPPRLHPARSASVDTLSTRHTLCEEPVTPGVETEYNPEIGITPYDELFGATNKDAALRVEDLHNMQMLA
ncbi:hypothetical protein BHE90_008091 [Fusarium euwallaceae]|uniref:Uncharacterized protein n=3 Tax=Fusarium solani species complex TaxID=232080 RepID=A0A3M2RYA5_9HYPO|nr:hypothetical protein CDV36_010132 [Fusarium kuroshium]RSL77736.1 hypothetical protein CEP51_008820 [Fusarium floridanum]RTE77419.1 hypothetical protein BHE90_008091 [Fusarium euwallaceae]